VFRLPIGTDLGFAVIRLANGHARELEISLTSAFAISGFKACDVGGARAS